MQKHAPKYCPGCSKRIRQAGRSNYCQPCFFKFRKVAPEIRFWRYVQKTDSCWLWTGSKSERGYGFFRMGTKGSHEHANRSSWKLHYGEIPEGFSVLHKCDNPPCVRPDHLWLGTAKDNMQDKIRKGRANTAYGMKGGNAKLTDKMVLEIRKLWTEGKVTQAELSRRFYVRQSQISRIILRQRWKHLPDMLEGPKSSI